MAIGEQLKLENLSAADLGRQIVRRHTYEGRWTGKEHTTETFGTLAGWGKAGIVFLRNAEGIAEVEMNQCWFCDTNVGKAVAVAAPTAEPVKETLVVNKEHYGWLLNCPPSDGNFKSNLQRADADTIKAVLQNTIKCNNKTNCGSCRNRRLLMPDTKTFSIEEQLAAVQREIGMRERVYPNLIANRKMTPAKAEYEKGAMQAVYESLKTLDNLQQINNAARPVTRRNECPNRKCKT